MRDGAFVEIVPPIEPAAAEMAFKQWLAKSGLAEADISPDDLLIDTVRGRDGRTLRRYRILQRPSPQTRTQ